jgi:transglutaminase-like putative cysteine protease
MKRLFIFLFLLSVINRVDAQVNYNVSLIPKDLLPYASAVIRDQNVSTEVKDNSTYYHIKTAITILNKNGDNMGRIAVWYDKTNIIKDIKGVVYNEFGQLAGKFSEKDFEDENAANDFSLFEDSRVKHFLPAIAAYPFTIVYEYELKSKQTLNFNDWKPNTHTGLAVEKSSYTFACRPTFDIRYKEINMPSKVIIGLTKDGLKTYTWQVTNLKALKEEPYSPISQSYLSAVKIAPVNFVYAGITGSFTNWAELGRWNYNKLLANRQALSPATVQHIKNLTAGITDIKQKAKVVYEYMQGRTRYISIQVGIGGYQPFLAEDVDRLNYGDCKALVNYTQALLKAADINSWYCVVEADPYRKISLLPDFASMNQGNHIILCLPLKNDTTFLECTSQKIPFGFLSDFTDDRIVLACTPEGGQLLHTPKYTATDNLQSRKASFEIASDGNLTGDMTTVYKGTQYDNPGELMDEPNREQIKTLQKMYGDISNLSIQTLEIKQDKKQMPVATETVKLSARDFASADNGKLYFALNSLNRQHSIRDIRNRVSPVYINRGYTDEDEIVYMLPAGYHPDMAPINLTLNKPFGKFKMSAVINGDKLVYHRRMELIDGTYDKQSYTELVEFYQAIADADAYNVTLIKD